MKNTISLATFASLIATLVILACASLPAGQRIEGHTRGATLAYLQDAENPGDPADVLRLADQLDVAATLVGGQPEGTTMPPGSLDGLADALAIELSWDSGWQLYLVNAVVVEIEAGATQGERPPTAQEVAALIRAASKGLRDAVERWREQNE